MLKILSNGTEGDRRSKIITASRTKDARYVPQLIALLADKSETYSNKRHAIRALGNIRDRTAEPVLRGLLESHSGPMLGELAEAMMNLDSTASIPLLEKHRRHKEEWVRQQVARALKALNRGD